MSTDDLKNALLLALESELTPRLREIDERLRDNHILILGLDYDVLSKRIDVTVTLPGRYDADKNEKGSVPFMESILNGVPGETVIHHRMSSKVAFHPQDLHAIIDITMTHSYVLMNGTYVQELGMKQSYLG